MEDLELKKIVKSQLDLGLTLNNIHKILVEEYSVKMTFMDLRILSSEIEDMDWSIFDPKKPVVEDDADAVLTESESVEGEILPEGTQIELSKIQRPGAMVSGFVTFLSGVRAEWVIDRSGQLDLSMEDDSESPTEDDMRDFQIKLREKLYG